MVVSALAGERGAEREMVSFDTFSTRSLEQGDTLQIGGLRITEVCSPPEMVRPTEPGAGGAGDLRDPQFLLALQTEGASITRQDAREAKLSAGDLTLCATSRPFEITVPGPGRCLLIGIPDAIMRRHLACPDEVVAIRMPGNRGMIGVLGNFIRTFWACRADAADPVVARRMSYTLLDLIAAAYSASSHIRQEQSSLVAAHRVRIIGYIEAHLRDPHLSPSSVARACRITARYLHHLFSSESETVTQYIQRRRLEECARALIAAPVRGRLVTGIAFDYGFNSLTHFGRVFRNQYGLTPSEYRRAAKH